MIKLDDEMKRQLSSIIEKQSSKFDHDAMALTAYRGSGYNYHTSVRNAEVHMIRESFYYALALLDRGYEGDSELAAAIVDRLLPYQELDKSNPNYGIWPYYIEEPFDQMGAVDRNWAEFCAKGLIQILVDYEECFPSELTDRMRRAVEAAAEAIARRDVSPSYTNICVMGTYVTLLAGELLLQDKLIQFGKDKLKRFHGYSLQQGEFTEYNSPTYTIVVIEDLSLMLRHIQDEESRALIEELHDMAWGSVAGHFHAATRQWAGPHSRCYNTLQGKGFLSFLQTAGGGRLRWLDDQEMEIGALWPRVHLHIPDQYLSYFQEGQAPRFEEKTIVKGDPILRAASYITPVYTLGSFNHCDLWNQRRPLVAYWGAPGRAAYMRLRCIHDDYDFSSGLLHAVQSDNVLLGICCLCQDHGDKHISLDKINGKITASYLAFRFEFGGDLGGFSLEADEQAGSGRKWLIRTPFVKIGLVLAGSLYGESIPSIETGEADGCRYLDIVLFKGEAAEIDLSRLEAAYAAFGLVIDHAEREDADLMSVLSYISSGRKDGKVELTYSGQGKSMRLSSPSAVLSYREAIRGGEHEKEELF